MFIGGLIHFHTQGQRTLTVDVNDHFRKHVPTTGFYGNFDPEIDRIYPIQPRNRFLYTAISYMLSSEAARVLVDIVDQYSFVTAADSMLIKLQDLVPGCYVTSEMLVNIPMPADLSLATSDDSNIKFEKQRLTGAPDIAPPASWMPCEF